MNTPSTYLVMADCFHAPDGPRAFQQVRPERLAVFSTLEEAENFVRAAASLDDPKHRGDKRCGYTIRWIPWDPPPSLYERMLQGEAESLWEALPRRNWHYDCQGVLYGSTDQSRAECDAHNALEEARLSTTPPPNPFRNIPPEFACGNLVRLQNWCLPDTYGVVAGVSTKKGLVRCLSESQEWLGRYAVVVAIENGLMDEYVYNRDIEPYLGGEHATITGVTEVPAEYKILQLLSDYFHGVLSIPDSVVEDLVNADIATRNVAYFPFEQFRPADHTTAVQATHDPTPPIVAPSGSPRYVEDITFKSHGGDQCYIVLVLNAKFPDFASKTVAIDEDWDSIAAFPTEEEARAFLKVLLKNHAEAFGTDNEIAHSFRFQLIALDGAIDSDATVAGESMEASERVTPCWCFNIAGRLLWELLDPPQAQLDIERYAYEGRYQKGDLVYVLPQGLDSESESIEGDFAVVSVVPAPKKSWLDGDNDPADWDAFYTVDFVDDGYLQHYRVPESSLQPRTSSVPDDLAFLAIWSSYVRGELDFPEGLADRVRAREVFLTNQPHFDFRAETIEAGMPQEYPPPRHRDFRVTHDR